MMIKQRERTVLEQYLLESQSWSAGYSEFTRLLGKPLGWLYALQNGSHRLIRLDQKGHCSFFAKSQSNQTSCAGFLDKYFEQLAERKEEAGEFPKFYHCAFGRTGAIFTLKHLGDTKGFLVLCAVGKSEREIEPYLGM